MTRYVQRDGTGKVIGHFANEQSYATEAVADNHADILAFQATRAQAATDALQITTTDNNFLDDVAFPSVVEAGSLTRGAPQRTSRFFRGLRVWRRTLAGFLPNQNGYVNKIDGVSNALVLGLAGADAAIVSQRAYVFVGSTERFYPLEFPSDTANSQVGPLLAWHLTHPTAGTRHLLVLLRNNHGSAAFNGKKFVAVFEYTDPQNPT